MVNPMTAMSAGTIVQLAFQAFLNPEVGKASISKASEILTEKVLTQMDVLRQKIWGRLRFKSRKMQELETTIKRSQQVTPNQLENIATYLQMELNHDEKFATEVKQLAQEIHQEISTMQQGQNVRNVPGGQEQPFNNQNINNQSTSDKTSAQQGTLTNHNHSGAPPQP
jgi:K+-sensing histidine kinase KdpD